MVLSEPRQASTTDALGGEERGGPLLGTISKEGEHTEEKWERILDGGGEDTGGTSSNSRTGPLLEPLPTEGPLLEPVTSGGEHTLDPDDRGMQSQVEPGTLELGDGSVGTKDVGTTDDVSLYNTASTVLMLREDRGECEVKRGWCVKHDRKANKITQKKSVWTKMKTGLYKYCTRKLSVWRCDRSMPTLVGTMRPREGAGVTTGSGG